METLVERRTDNRLEDKFKHIPGWGMDANPEDKPNYPMKKYNGADHQRLNYVRAPQQPESVEILHSNERPSLTRVFGTAAPPSGLSGALRKYAFRFSEGSSGHWLTLLLADRINVVEGVVDDLAHGHIPNFFKEKGLAAEWKYNRKSAVTKLAIGITVSAALITYWTLKSKRKTLRLT